MPCCTGAPKDCYTICRFWSCAGLLFPLTRRVRCRVCGDRGCLTGDHLTIDVLRYPDPYGVRAILMVPRSSVHPSGVTYLLNCWYCELLGDLVTAPLLRQPAPSPVLRLLRLGTPLPNFPARAPQPGAFTEGLLVLLAALLGGP